MAKITQVTIISPTTLRLDVDAKTGDEIDLLDISKIDNMLIQEIINKEKEKEIKKLLDEQKRLYDLEKTNEINERTEKLKEENSQLKNEIKTIANETKLQTELALKDKIFELQSQVNQINSEKIQIEQLKNEEIEKIKTQLQLKMVEQEATYQLQLQEKEKIISNLELTKSNLNIKKIGEQLELWCNTEYENYAQCGFETCSWEKYNLSIKDDGDTKGTKADYIFKVYATKEMRSAELLTSVVCEMKNESPSSTNKKKNADHYAKLDKDRMKKNCEYALLISELEWDQPNDLPIKKVKEYDKMYVVRPQYFINFLSLITSLSFRFKELILDNMKEQEKFKDSLEIKQEFEKFKKDLMDKPLEKLEKELNAIIKNANDIKASSDKIITSASDLINKTLENMKSKIENFKIDKLCKKIDKLDLE